MMDEHASGAGLATLVPAEPPTDASPQATGAKPQPDASPQATGAKPQPDASPQATSAKPGSDASPPATSAKPQPDASPQATGAKPQPEKDFASVLRDVEEAAREWGIRPDLLEGRFVSALMAAIGWTGRVSEAAQAEFKELFRKNRDTAELELARAREITKAAQIALSQARNAQISLQIERENVIERMIHATLPLFLERLQGALVIREKAWNDGVQRWRYAVVGLVTLGLFLGGFALGAWEEGGPPDLLSQCLAHPLQAQGHIYCDLTKLAQAGP